MIFLQFIWKQNRNNNMNTDSSKKEKEEEEEKTKHNNIEPQKSPEVRQLIWTNSAFCLLSAL